MESNTSLGELGRSWQLQSCWRDVQEEEEGWKMPSSTTCLEKSNPRHWLLSVLVPCFWFYLFFLCGEWGSPKERAVWRALFLPPACSWSPSSPLRVNAGSLVAMTASIMQGWGSGEITAWEMCSNEYSNVNITSAVSVAPSPEGRGSFGSTFISLKRKP